MAIPDPFKAFSGQSGKPGNPPRFPIPAAYSALCAKADKEGQRVELFAHAGRFTAILLKKDEKVVGTIGMSPPRPLTLEQAAKQLLDRTA